MPTQTEFRKLPVKLFFSLVEFQGLTDLTPKMQRGMIGRGELTSVRRGDGRIEIPLSDVVGLLKRAGLDLEGTWALLLSKGHYVPKEVLLPTFLRGNL